MKKTKHYLSAALLAAAAGMTIASTGHAQNVDALLNKLVDKGVLSGQEAEDLRAESNRGFDKELSSKIGLPEWDKNLKLGGDFRLRMDEMFPENGLGRPERLRFRYRFRYGAVWTANDWVTVGFRLGSGDYRSALGDGNPNSNNQTATHAFSKKPLFIDAAYVTFQPPGADWISVTGGKMNTLTWQPSFNSPMTYDPDLTPEGLIEQLNFKFGEHKQFSVFANMSELVLDELSGDTRDVYVYDGELGATASLLGDAKSPALKITAAGGYFMTQNLTHMPTGDNSGNVGNSVNGANYLSDFQIAYARGEAAWRLGDKPFLGTPCQLTLSGEYDKNVDSAYKVAGDLTTAWTGQIMFGQAAKKGQWQIAYQYKRVEANALFDSMSDDDFGGGTDREGHIIKAAYNIRDWWSLGFTTFITRKISTDANSGHNQVGIAGQDQVRLFVDTMVKF